MTQIIYHYSYRSEDILSSTITVTKLNSELYQIVFIQENLTPDFKKIETSYTLISKESHIDFEDINETTIMYKNTTKIKIKASCNPPPEKLFRIN